MREGVATLRVLRSADFERYFPGLLADTRAKAGDAKAPGPSGADPGPGFFRDTQKWKAGPHLFIDDAQIWVFTPLTVSGTHSPSFNKIALGIEMVGDYEKEAFDSGRGLKVRQNTVAAIATLSAILGLDPNTMKIHREDPATTHACPGKNVRKLEVIQEVHDLLATRHGGEHGG